eukprot:Gb_16289 [translate_table: standard]
MLFAHASSAFSRGCFESMMVLILPSLTKSTMNARSLAFPETMNGTSRCLARVTFFAMLLANDMKFGVRSITFPEGLRLGWNIDHGIFEVQCITASYLWPDGLFKAAPSGVLYSNTSSAPKSLIRLILRAPHVAVTCVLPSFAICTA